MKPMSIAEAKAEAEALILSTVNDGRDKPFDRCVITLWGDETGTEPFFGVRVAEIDLQWGPVGGGVGTGGSTYFQTVPDCHAHIFAVERFILDRVCDEKVIGDIKMCRDETAYFLAQAFGE